MKLEILTRKFIRPSSPTPPHLKTFKLSLLDQRIPSSLYGQMILFYPNNNNNHVDLAALFSERSNHLQKSLSKTLVHFYPFAGRLKDDVTIDCNDEGAYFIEAKINCSLTDVLSQLDPNSLGNFLPCTNNAEVANVITLFQLTLFNCGAIAIGVCPSHKIADASSVFTFFRSFTAESRGQVGVLPEFIEPSQLPPTNTEVRSTSGNIVQEKFITRRFVFGPSKKMDSLKAKASKLLEELGYNSPPSNVELVSAILLKCIMIASSHSGPTLMSQAMNLRRRMVPSRPEYTIGNLIYEFKVLIEENDMELHEIVAKIRKEIKDFSRVKAIRFNAQDALSVISESLREEAEMINKMGANIFWFSSVCGFPLYDMDFGWGKPIWATIRPTFKNLVALMDTKGGEGVEVWVSLDEKQMATFERSELLLSFATLNPSAL